MIKLLSLLLLAAPPVTPTASLVNACDIAFEDTQQTKECTAKDVGRIEVLLTRFAPWKTTCLCQEHVSTFPKAELPRSEREASFNSSLTALADFVMNCSARTVDWRSGEQRQDVACYFSSDEMSSAEFTPTARQIRSWGFDA